MILLCEFEVHNGTTISKLYVGTHGIRSGPTDTPANQYYEPRLSSVGRVERSMFSSGDGVSGGTTGGQSQVGFGNISVLNGTPYGEGDLIDHWKNLAFRSVTIKSLTGESQSYAQAQTRFVGSIENLVSTNALEQYDLVLHDRLQDLDQPLLTNVYLGTTNQGGDGTVEGDTDLKDQVKQKVWGTVHNVPTVSVNPFDLVWQVSDGEVASIIVYDGGVALTDAGNVGTLAALFSTGVALGSYLTCTPLGLFILGSPPQGDLTADVIEGATVADRTAAQIASRMVDWFQDAYPHLNVALTTSDVTALDALNSAECGILVTDTESGLAAITRVLTSIGAWMLPRSNSTSMFDLGRMDLPSGAAVASYDLEDNVGGNPQRIESGDDSRGVPCWKLTVRYDQLATVQSASDLFGVVTENDPIRVQYLSTEWRQASVEDENILLIWPNAPTLTVDTRLVTPAAAQAEATRLFALHSVQRDIWRIKVPMSPDPADDPGIGEVVELTSRSGRMGLGREIGLGETFRCLGRVDDFDEVPTLELTLWGAAALVATTPTMSGRLVASETDDTAALTASVMIPLTGTFAATEATDTAAVAGNVTDAVISGLILRYKFNDLTTTDSSGNGNTGTIGGSGTTLVAGHAGNALSFNGSGYVTFANVTLLKLASATSEMSIACWIKTSLTDCAIASLRNSGNGSPVIDFFVGYNFVDNAFSGRPSVLVRDDLGVGLTTINGASAINNNAWHHVAWTRNAAKLNTLYIDGVFSVSVTDTMTSAVTPNVAGSSIAWERLNTATLFTGLMDDFQVYDRALTSTEVAAIYATGGA